MRCRVVSGHGPAASAPPASWLEMPILQASLQASSSASRGVAPAGSSNRPSRALWCWQSFVQRNSALARPLSRMKMHLQPEMCFRHNMLESQPDVMQGFFTWQSVKIALLFTNLSPGPPSERLGMRRSGVWPGLAASARDMGLGTFSIKIRVNYLRGLQDLLSLWQLLDSTAME